MYFCLIILNVLFNGGFCFIILECLSNGYFYPYNARTCFLIGNLLLHNAKMIFFDDYFCLVIGKRLLSLIIINTYDFS